MPSFGEKLRLEREKRKITLDQISSSTKIGTRMLQALEEDKFSQLPGGIFNKGFVRAYARVVGLDEDQTVADYLLASGEAPVIRPESNSRGGIREAAVHEPEENGRLEIRAEAASRQLPWGMFAVILLITALALTLWTRTRREHERTLTQTPAEKTTLAPAPVQPPAPTESKESAPPSSSVHPSLFSEHVNPAGIHSATGSSESKPSTQSTPTSAATSPAPGEFSVLILAREESWVSIAIDGKPSISSTLVAGEQRTIQADQQALVKTGNAGGLEFWLNGKKLETGGEFGEVKSYTITRSGLLPGVPTPAPIQH